MKKIILLCLVLIGMNMSAQPPGPDRSEARKDMREKMDKLSPEQKAELKTKQLTLSLDLTPAQEKQMRKLNLEIEQKRAQKRSNQAKEEEITPEELYNRTLERLDERIATKKRIKEILTEEQFEKFEQSKDRKARMRKHRFGKKRR